ncbi:MULTISPECIES: LuxR C-terminal-related transcriptional regulator [unclassified Rhodosalinus]|uniref:response regulator transcription factor n=1 Tax=unclassified Rhodosalinus TaxID=2630183 RepID=UPI003523E9A9
MKVYVVCREKLVASLLRGCLEQAGLGPIEIRESLTEFADDRADATVVVHDNQPGDALIEDLHAHTTRAPQHRLILVTCEPLPDDTASRLANMLSAMLTNDCTSEALLGAVSVVRAGFSVSRGMHPAAAASSPLRERPGMADGPPVPDLENRMAPATLRLSVRELAILRKLTGGVSNKDIAKDLGICESTVKVHLRTCYRKIGARNRTQAAMWASEHLKDSPC